MGLGIKDKSQTMDLLGFYQILIQTMELLGFYLFLIQTADSFSAVRLVLLIITLCKTFQNIFLVNHKENVSFHIIAKNDKRNSHISSWP